MYQPIACEYHDYIEIACMKSYTLEIFLKGAQCIIAEARTTQTTSDKREMLVLIKDEEELSIALDEILSFEPLNEGALFGLINLSPAE